MGSLCLLLLLLSSFSFFSSSSSFGSIAFSCNMIARVSLLLLVAVGLLTDARPPKKDGVQRRREEWVVKSLRNETYAPMPPQGDCLEGWFDCSEVGLGCIYPDLT